MNAVDCVEIGDTVVLNTAPEAPWILKYLEVLVSLTVEKTIPATNKKTIVETSLFFFFFSPI